MQLLRRRGKDLTPEYRIASPIKYLPTVVRGLLALVMAEIVATSARAQQSAVQPSLALEGVMVVDVERGKLIPDQRVVIAGTHIRAVGSRRTLKLPKNVQVVSARGKYLIPGLWDMHSHAGMLQTDFIGRPNLKITTELAYLLDIANGVTGFRDAYAAEVPLDTMALWHREILAGTRVGPPRQYLSGVAMFSSASDTGVSVNRNLMGVAWVPPDTASIIHLVRVLKAAGASFVKTYGLDAKTYFIVTAIARREGLLVGGHAPYVSPFDAADSGVSIVDHPTQGEVNLLSPLCFDPNESTVEGCRQIAERFKRTNTWSVPTLAIYAGKYFPEEITFERHVSENGEVRFSRAWGSTEPQHYAHNLLRKAVTNFWTDFTYNPAWLRNHITLPLPTAPPTMPSDPRWDYAFGAWNFFYLKIAMEVGLPILAGGDTEGVESGFKLHAELATLVDRGLTPLAALQAATLNPAKMLRATDSLGTVAPGKLADLVLLDANPLEDITNTTMIRAVVANGRYFDRAALDGLLNEIRVKVKTQAP